MKIKQNKFDIEIYFNPIAPRKAKIVYRVNYLIQYKRYVDI